MCIPVVPAPVLQCICLKSGISGFLQAVVHGMSCNGMSWHVALALYKGTCSLQAVTAVMFLSCFMEKHQAALSLFGLQLLPLRAMSGLDNHQPL